jgi:hypothetical protein
MDELISRAVDHYHALLRDEKELREDVEARFLDRMRQANLTFGGRVLCPFPRPNLVSPAVYDQIRGVCRRIFRAIEKLEARLGPELWSRVDLSDEERELVAIDPGYRRSSPSARLDSFLTTSKYQFVELNAETPAGIAYAEVLTEIFLELPVVKRFQERYALRRFAARDRMLDTLLACYREAGGKKPKPTIAIVDYEDVPTRTEHHLFRVFFESKGYPSIVCDPRHLSFERGQLFHDTLPIDIVYKRLLVNELLEKKNELKPLIDAAKARAFVMVNPFRCKPIHKKAIFAVLTDDELMGLFGEDEQAAIRAHVPWTRRVAAAHATKDGQSIDLPEYIRKNRERLVMKPNDEYGGKGVFIGWEMTDAEWDQALGQALSASYVVQEKVELLRQTFPQMEKSLAFKELVVDLDPFVFAGEVEGFLTRLSGTSLANVTSGGGQVPAFLIEPKN